MSQTNGVRIVKGFGWILLAASLVTTLSIRAGHDQPTEDLVYFLPIAAERAKQLLDSGEKLIFIDLREPAAFAARRLPGARSIPLKELPQRLEEVPKTGRVVLYCGCPPGKVEEAYAYQLLRDNGYRNVSVLAEGFEGWGQRGYPLVAGKP